MKKFFKILTATTLLFVFSVVLVGCKSNVLWKADINDNNLFGVYGTVEKNDNSLILKRPDGANYAGSTYFGESDKNFEWENSGLTVSLNVNIDTSKYGQNDYSVWSLALNENDGKYITENSVFFVGTDSNVKFIYKNIGVETDYSVLTEEETAVSLTTGDYTIKFDYNVNDNKEIILDVLLLDSENTKIYSSLNNKVVVIEHDGYTPNSPLKEENVGGLRYLWLARTTVNGVVKGLKITK